MEGLSGPVHILFQYPVSDRMGCNASVIIWIAETSGAFSILYRIEWVVTQFGNLTGYATACFQYPVSDRMGCNEIDAEKASVVAFIDFQYPVSDRMGCNQVSDITPTIIKSLSVSCIGSNGL